MMFRVGMKVVCVDAFGVARRHLLEGEEYTIGAVSHIGQEFVGVTIAPGLLWFPRRFRPVHTTDISIFEAMLMPTPKEKVEA